GGDSNEPSSAGSITTGTCVFISPSSTALGTFNNAPPNRSTNVSFTGTGLSSYSAFQYQRDKTGVFSVGEANRTDFRSMGLGWRNSGAATDPSVSTGFCFLFQQVQAKGNTQTLTLTFRYTWSRTL